MLLVLRQPRSFCGDFVTCKPLLDEAELILTGASDNDRSGYAVTGVGDVNSDGLADLLIGAYANDDGGSDAGAAQGPLRSPYSRTASTMGSAK